MSVSAATTHHGKETTIYGTAELKRRWPAPLAEEWYQRYPDLFDILDLNQTRLQHQKHFPEWFAAVHLFHRDGLFSLIEDYAFAKHERKTRVLQELLSEEERHFLLNLDARPPDLLVFPPDRSAYWFAEVQGPRDTLTRKQRKNHDRIGKSLGVPVEIIQVRIR